MAGLDRKKMDKASKDKKLSDFQKRFRKGFGGGKDLKQKKGNGILKKLFGK